MNGRTLFRIHSWIGVMAGLILFVVCWSGTVATVSREIDWLLNPAMRVTPGPERATWGTIEAAVRHAFPEARINSFSAPEGAASAAEIGIDLGEQSSIRVYVDPYTAKVTGSSSYFNVQRFFRSFHMNLFSGKFGYYVVFSLSLFLLASLVTPLIFYKRWWQRFFRLKTDKGLKVLVSDAHKTFGLWAIWFAAIIGLTGVWYLFEGARLDFGDGKVVFAGTHEAAVVRVPSLPETVRNAALPIDTLVAKAREHRPDLVIRTISWDGGLLYIDGQSTHWLVRDRANKLYLDPRDGAVVFSQFASGQPLYWRWSDTADPLHFGDFGGLATKLVWFVFGLGLTGLTLTGAWLHSQRLIRGSVRPSSARWAGTGTAIALTIGMLAFSAYGGAEEIRGYGPVVGGVQLWPDVPGPVIAFIIVWIAATVFAVAWWIRLLWSRKVVDLSLINARMSQVPAE
jgi:uncharacterized iron-regulated membrane protein